MVCNDVLFTSSVSFASNLIETYHFSMASIQTIRLTNITHHSHHTHPNHYTYTTTPKPLHSHHCTHRATALDSSGRAREGEGSDPGVPPDEGGLGEADGVPPRTAPEATGRTEA